MNAIFICVIILDKMCFHMLNLCWFKYKKIFKCFRCFWKVLCFYKNWKISKTMLPYFSDLVAGHPSLMLHQRARGLILTTCSRVKGPVARERSSREGYTEIFTAQLATPLQVDLPVAKNTLKIFPQLWLWVFWRLALATCFSREKCLFCISKTVFKTFSVFPSTFCDCSLSSPFLSQLKLTQTLSVTLYKLHFCTFAPPNLQEKCMGSHFLTSYLVFWTSFSWIFVLFFFFLLWVCFDFWDCPCLVCWGIVLTRTCFSW